MVGSCLVGPGGPRSTAEARGSDRRVAAAAAFGRRPAPEAAFLSRRRKVSRVIIPDPVAVVGRAEAQRNPRIPKTPAASSASSRAAASVDDASTSEGPAADAPDDEAWTPPPWMVAWYTRKAKLSLDGPRYLRDIGADLRLASRVLALRPRFASLSDRALASVTRELRARLAGGETIREVREDAFAAVREAARRSLGLEPYPVQLAGASALLDGRCVEMGTGEGKSLMALLPAYLLALQGGDATSSPSTTTSPRGTRTRQADASASSGCRSASLPNTTPPTSSGKTTSATSSTPRLRPLGSIFCGAGTPRLPGR